MTMVGRARGELPAIPAELAELDCRNNRLLARALDEISPAVAELGATASAPHASPVVLGTSTSGIAAGEEAAATLAREGRMPSRYHYRQQEIGTAAEFAARYLGLTGLRYTISTACSSSAKAFASARALARGRLLRRGDRRRRRQPMRADAERFRRARVARARASAIRSAPTGAASTSAKAPACSSCRGGRARFASAASANRRTVTTSRRRTRAAAAPKPRSARRSRDAGADAARRRLRQSPRHGHAEERRDGERRHGASVRSRRAVQLHEVADRSHARRRGCAGARVLLACCSATATAHGGCRRTCGTACATRTCRRSTSSVANTRLRARRVRLELIRVRRQQCVDRHR